MATPKPREINGWIIRPSENAPSASGADLARIVVLPTPAAPGAVFNVDYATAISNENFARACRKSCTEPGANS